MKSYTANLLEDLKKAHRSSSEDADKATPASFVEMEAIENWVAGNDPPATLAKHTGLAIEQFPSADQFTREDLIAIIDAFQEMLLTWNMQADFPSNLPAERAYPLLIGLLKEEAWFLPGGMLHHDFCTGYAPDCELLEYCPCTEHWNI
ncbi:MAG: hypothetical protein SH808_08535 [Saprospiraceae bacterium]|nr:hypothetical protein [Saprospiraceae bacterium]